MLILQPRNNQVQHIVVKVMGKQGKSDILSRVRSIAQGGAIVHFLSRFGAFEKVSANDRPRRCDRSQEQNVTSMKLTKNEKKLSKS
jgi:hypothetical protein